MASGSSLELSFASKSMYSSCMLSCFDYSFRADSLRIAAPSESFFLMNLFISPEMHHRRGRFCRPDDLVFMTSIAGTWMYLVKPVAEKVLAGQIKKMGLTPTDYRFHAFRFGSLQEAVLHEPSLEVIRVQSDHSSEAIHGYCGLPPERRFRVTQRMGASLRGFESRCRSRP